MKARVDAGDTARVLYTTHPLRRPRLESRSLLANSREEGKAGAGGERCRGPQSSHAADTQAVSQLLLKISMEVVRVGDYRILVDLCALLRHECLCAYGVCLRCIA